MTKSTQLQRNVLAELDWDPRIDAAMIGVTVDEGVVTLTGTTDSYEGKIAAEKAVKRVTGVKAVANDLEVRLPASSKRTDPDLAKAVVHALEWDVRIPPNRVTATVKDGWITLEGEVDWNFEREEAGKAVRRLTGVIGVSNLITIKPCLDAAVVKAKIEDALRRNAELEAARIGVDVDGAKVTLRGAVRSWTEREDAEHAAWAARGVGAVLNHLAVEEEQLTGFGG